MLIVDVEPCGPALCGTIVKVLANRSMDGGAAPMAANTPGVGLKILTGFQRQGDGAWTGRLYNRENGKTYDSRISLESRDQLKVRGLCAAAADRQDPALATHALSLGGAQLTAGYLTFEGSKRLPRRNEYRGNRFEETPDDGTRP